MDPVKSLMHSIFFRLSLKDNPFLSYTAASKHEMDAFFDVLHDIDPSISTKDRSKDCLKKHPSLSEFMQHCCHERNYVFGDKKCGKLDCSICKPPRLPEDVFKQLCHLPDPVPDTDMHYKSFTSLYGTLTTEKHLPSLKSKGKSSHGIPFSLNSHTARVLILCSECLRPRVVYSQRKLSVLEETVFSSTTVDLLYTCGNTLKGVEVEIRRDEPLSVLTLFERVFVRANLTCDEPVEIPYYSSEKLVNSYLFKLCMQ